MAVRSFLLGIWASALAMAAGNPAPPTFYKNVLPVMQNRCQECHRPGEAAPMSFMTYQEVRPWAKAIREAVITNKMPPWPADPHYSKFSNDRSLSRAEIDTLVAWVDSGAREGDPSQAPKPAQFVAGWDIHKPDVVFEMPNEFAVPASGTLEYQYIVIPSGFTEDKWVQESEARPGNRQVVHHIIAFIRPPGSKWMQEAQPGIPFVPVKEDKEKRKHKKDNDSGPPPELLVGFAPGLPPGILRPGQAKLVKAGSDFVFQMHYTANGKPGTDRSRVGLVFARTAAQGARVYRGRHQRQVCHSRGRCELRGRVRCYFAGARAIGRHDAAHAPARQRFRLHGLLSDRRIRSAVARSEVRFQLAAFLLPA